MTVLLDEDSLNGTDRCRAQDVLTLRFVRGGIVPERFLPMQFEDVGGEKTTLGVGLAPIEINHHMDGARRCSRFCHVWMCLCHLFFLPVHVRSLLSGRVHVAPVRATLWCPFACSWSAFQQRVGTPLDYPLQRVFPHAKAHPAALRAATQVTHLVLSGSSLRRKRHESAMSSVMNGKVIKSRYFKRTYSHKNCKETGGG